MRRFTSQYEFGRQLVVLVAFMLLPVLADAQTQSAIKGIVEDQTGAPIVAAHVLLYSNESLRAESITDRNGEFRLVNFGSDQPTVVVRASGFAELKRQLISETDYLKLVLTPASINEQVVITPARIGMPVDEVSANVAVLSSDLLSRSAADTLDDALRQLAGFQLFRRSGSRTANPTSQGLSLRGVGASGASRALVLCDGVPLNDPFGGWVYWSRVPIIAIESVEVVRGASNLYGNSALGGVVQVISKPADRSALTVETSIGNEETREGSLFFSENRSGWGVTLASEIATTSGYIPVAETERGTIDTKAGSRHSTLVVSLEREISDATRLFLRGSLFGESRTNGTALQTNRTHSRQISAGIDWHDAQAGVFSFRGYAARQVYDQTFTAVNAGRSNESLTRLQRVPAQIVGFSSMWSRDSGDGKNTIAAGVDMRLTRGTSDELAFAQNLASAAISSGGREQTVGGFIEDILRPHRRVVLSASLRFDRWLNYRGSSSVRSMTTNGVANTLFPDRSESALSPQGTALFHVNSVLSFHFSAGQAFRQPTLNELYRSFRVGDVLTLANEGLRAERLSGVEGGATIQSKNTRNLRARSSFFWTRIENPIINATLNVTPSLVTRQRQNLGAIRTRGFEIEAEASLTQNLSVTAGYLFTDARIVSIPGRSALEGLRVPQVPRQQATAQLWYSNRRLVSLGIQARAAGNQFEDDQNRLRLGSYFQLDSRVSRNLSHSVEIFIAAENLLNSRYSIGRTPITTVASPMLVRVGMRFQLRNQ